MWGWTSFEQLAQDHLGRPEGHGHGRPPESGRHSATEFDRRENRGNLECVRRERRSGGQAQRRKRTTFFGLFRAYSGRSSLQTPIP